MRKQALARGVTLYCGDCIEALATVPAASIDSIVCDPPYHLKFMGKRWDGGDIAFRPETWAAMLRVMKPGAHLVAFGGTRTYHRMACAIEDAGFEVRDTIAWLYGSGFPKSHDVSKAIDRKAGAVRKVVGARTKIQSYGRDANNVYGDGPDKGGRQFITAPATAAARAWAGFGTALKPAFEPIILARKPLGPGMTVAGNVLRYGTGGIDIDGCRVAGEPIGSRNNNVSLGSASGGIYGKARGFLSEAHASGRWPANLVHDGSDEVLNGFPEQVSGGTPPSRPRDKTRNTYGSFNGVENPNGIGSTRGSAARFFYCAKASKRDRLGSKHPTVKPIALMQWLVRLVTPPGGTVLDPFAGTGTTGEAARREGFRAILIEREREYQADIRRRIAATTTSPAQERRIGADRLKRRAGVQTAARRRRAISPLPHATGTPRFNRTTA